jgi:hypothetical protein
LSKKFQKAKRENSEEYDLSQAALDLRSAKKEQAEEKERYEQALENLKAIQSYKEGEERLVELKEGLEKAEAELLEQGEEIQEYMETHDKEIDKNIKSIEKNKEKGDKFMKSLKAIIKPLIDYPVKFANNVIDRGKLQEWLLRIFLAGISLPIKELPVGANIVVNLMDMGPMIIAHIPRIVLKPVELSILTVPDAPDEYPTLALERSGGSMDWSVVWSFLSSLNPGQLSGVIDFSALLDSLNRIQLLEFLKSIDPSSLYEHLKQIDSNIFENVDMSRFMEVLESLDPSELVELLKKADPSKLFENIDISQFIEVLQSINPSKIGSIIDIPKLLDVFDGIEVPKRPSLPTLPKFPDIDFSLPALEMPSLPSIDVPEFPTPSLAWLEGIMGAVDAVLNIMGMLSLGIAPIPEWKMNAEVTHHADTEMKPLRTNLHFNPPAISLAPVRSAEPREIEIKVETKPIEVLKEQSESIQSLADNYTCTIEKIRSILNDVEPTGDCAITGQEIMSSSGILTNILDSDWRNWTASTTNVSAIPTSTPPGFDYDAFIQQKHSIRTQKLLYRSPNSNKRRSNTGETYRRNAYKFPRYG